MAGLGVRLFTDEHIHKDLAGTLRDRGYDALNCQETGRRGVSDEEQLVYAAQRGRAILTFNVNDFYQLEHLWKATGRHHAGIIVAAVVEDLGELLRRVQRHLDTIGPDVQRDTLQRLARE